jgi:hypothetical protein
VYSVSIIGFVTVLQRPHRKNSYKPNGRNIDHTVRTVTHPMVETEYTRKNSYKLNGRNRVHTVRTVINPMVEKETTP